MKNNDYNDPNVKKYLRSFRCSTESDPEIKICCLDDKSLSPINNIRNIRSTTEPALTRSTIDQFQVSNSQTFQTISSSTQFSMTNRVLDQLPNPDLQACGQQESDNRIVGGEVAGLDEYPWLALFKYRKQNTIEYACAGALINDEYILTAAHCVDPQIIKAKNLGKL